MLASLAKFAIRCQQKAGSFLDLYVCVYRIDLKAKKQEKKREISLTPGVFPSVANIIILKGLSSYLSKSTFMNPSSDKNCDIWLNVPEKKKTTTFFSGNVSSAPFIGLTDTKFCQVTEGFFSQKAVHINKQFINIKYIFIFYITFTFFQMLYLRLRSFVFIKFGVCV